MPVSLLYQRHIESGVAVQACQNFSSCLCVRQRLCGCDHGVNAAAAVAGQQLPGSGYTRAVDAAAHPAA